MGTGKKASCEALCYMRGCKAQVTSTYGNVTGIQRWRQECYTGRKRTTTRRRPEDCVCGAYKSRTTDRFLHLGCLESQVGVEPAAGLLPFEYKGCAQQAYRNVLLTLSAQSDYTEDGVGRLLLGFGSGGSPPHLYQMELGNRMLVTSVLPPFECSCCHFAER